MQNLVEGKYKPQVLHICDSKMSLGDNNVPSDKL